MKLIEELLFNFPLITAGIAFLVSQVSKVVYYYFREKKLDIMHFFEAAGMPSTHSAMSCALSLAVGFSQGFNSPLFAIALIFTIVVMYDAMGVRLATGQQANVLNKIIEDIYSEKVSEKEKLKELIGHTPLEVFAGGVLGILIAIIMYLIVY